MLTIESISSEILLVPPSFEHALSQFFPEQLRLEIEVLPREILPHLTEIRRICDDAWREQRISLGFEAQREAPKLEDSSVVSASSSGSPEPSAGKRVCRAPPLPVRPQIVRHRRGRKRIYEELPPIDPNGSPVTVYQRLKDYGLLRKLTDIVLAKASVPWNLRDDAEQEIHLAWLGLFVKPQFVRNQVAKYAYLAGQHAALKLRRSIGAVVTIPGVLFRSNKNHPFLQSIGAAVNPHDIDDFHNNSELSHDNKSSEDSFINEEFFENRIRELNLTQQQRSVAHAFLVERQNASDVAEALGVTLAVIERLIEQVVKKLHAFDAACSSLAETNSDNPFGGEEFNSLRDKNLLIGGTSDCSKNHKQAESVPGMLARDGTVTPLCRAHSARNHYRATHSKTTAHRRLSL